MESMPIIKLEIQEMQHQILHYFTLYQEEVSKAVREEIEKVIKNFDYEGAVREAANDVITGAIRNYFKYGKGQYIINQTIDEALNNLFTQKENNAKNQSSKK